MYCEKCGNKLIEVAKFCDKCGASVAVDINNSNSSIEVKVSKKIEDNTILYSIKPTYKFWYSIMGLLSFLVIIGLFFGITTYQSLQPSVSKLPALTGYTSDILNEYGSDVLNEYNSTALNISFWYALVCLVIILLTVWFTKMQYKAFEYNFYVTKLIYRDSFINITEKEIKYKHLREVQMIQSFVQRWFNIGKIIMYTNAESGMSNGITVVSVENPKQVYDEVKKIIDGGN